MSTQGLTGQKAILSAPQVKGQGAAGQVTRNYTCTPKLGRRTLPLLMSCGTTRDTCTAYNTVAQVRTQQYMLQANTQSRKVLPSWCIERTV